MRTRNTILNFITVYGFYITKLLLDLVRIKMFIGSYGQSLHSLHQVYYNVFQCLSIVESGIGIAVVYKLYKPLAEKQHDQVNVVYSSLNRLFKLLGAFIIVASFFVSFALPLLINNNPFEFSFLQLTFIIYVVREAVTYFMCAPQFIITADHQKYKINAFIHGGLVVEQIAEIIMIKLGVPYAIYLIPAFFIRLIEYFIINRKVKREYPWLKYVKEDDKTLHKDVFDLFFINIFDLVHTNSAVIFLSSLTTPLLVSIYSFYNYIVKFCYRSTSYLYESMKNGVGNLVVTAPVEEISDEMRRTRVLYSYIAVLLVVLLYFSMSPFIGLWQGNEYVVDELALILFLGVIYCKVILNEARLLVEVYGLFHQVKWGLLAAAGINIVMSIILVKNYGLIGVLASTIVTDAAIVLVLYSYTGYKHLTGHYSFSYVSHNIINIVIVVVVIVILKVVNIINFIPCTSMVMWFVYSCINGIAALLLVTGLFAIAYKDSFMRTIKRVTGVIGRMLHRKKEIA